MTVVVIGAEGRIGHLLCSQAPDAVPVTRCQDPFGLDQPGPAVPVLVSTRNRDLAAVVNRVHPSRHCDLVFVQNGMVRPWLGDRGLLACTQGVIWAAVPKKGDSPIPGGVSPFFGPWAEAVADLFRRCGVDASAVDETTYLREVAVKLGWILVYGALGSATGAKVGEIASDHTRAVRALADEVHPLLAQEPGLDLDADAFFGRLQRYSARIPHFPSAVKEWRWRNGWQRAAGARLGLAQSRLDATLRAAGIDPETGP